MKGNRRLDFLKSIRLQSEEADSRRSKPVTPGKHIHNMTRQEEDDLQKELERRFNELFGTTSGD